MILVARTAPKADQVSRIEFRTLTYLRNLDGTTQAVLVLAVGGETETLAGAGTSFDIALRNALKPYASDVEVISHQAKKLGKRKEAAWKVTLVLCRGCDTPEKRVAYDADSHVATARAFVSFLNDEPT